MRQGMNNQASVVGQDGKPCAVPSHETLRQPSDYHNDDDDSSVVATPDENHHSASASRQPQPQQHGQATLQTFLEVHVPTDVLRQVGTRFLHHAMTQQQQQQQPWRYIAFIRRHFDQWVEFAAAIILAAEQAQQLEVNQAAHIIQQALFRLDESSSSSSSGEEEGSTANASLSPLLLSSSPPNVSKTTQQQQQQQKTTLSLHDDDTSQLAQALQLCILQGFADDFLRKHCLAFVTAIEGQAQGTALVLSWLGGKDTHDTITTPSKNNGCEASSTKLIATSDTAVKTIPTALRKEMAKRTRMPPPPPPPPPPQRHQQQQQDDDEEEDTSKNDVRKAHKRPRSNTPSQRILTEGTSSSGHKLFPTLLQSTTVPTKLDLSGIVSTTLSMQDWQRWGQMLACKQHTHGWGGVQELSLPVLPPAHLQAFANCFSNGHFRKVALVHDNNENNISSSSFPIFGGNQVQSAFESLGRILSKSLALLLYRTAYSLVDVLPGLVKGFASLLSKQPSLRLVFPLSSMSDPSCHVGQAILETNIVSDLWVEARNMALDETFYRALTLIVRTPSLRTLYICDATCHPIVFHGNIWQNLQSAFVASRLQTLVLGNLQGGTQQEQQQQQQHAGTDFLTSLFAAMASQQQQDDDDEEEEPSLNGAACRYLSHLWLSFHPNCKSWGVVVHQSLALRLAACRHLTRLTCDFYPETLAALRQAAATTTTTAAAAGSIQLVEATPAAVVVQKGGDSSSNFATIINTRTTHQCSMTIGK